MVAVCLSGVIHATTFFLLIDGSAIGVQGRGLAPLSDAKALDVHLMGGVAVSLLDQKVANDSSDVPQLTKRDVPSSRSPVSVDTDHQVSLLHDLQDAYLPTSLVDKRPFPVSTVILPFPNAALGKPRGSAVLALYIGREGSVDRVDIESSMLPEEFERVAMETFRSSRFQPALRGGSVVKSILRIEVEFIEP